jgi:hypothetical protein
LKTTDREIIEILKDKGFSVKKVDFLKHGYILENGDKNDLWALDIFKQ